MEWKLSVLLAKYFEDTPDFLDILQDKFQELNQQLDRR